MKTKEFIFVYTQKSQRGSLKCITKTLQNVITEKLAEGYELYGTAFFCCDMNLMCQAMVKYEEPILIDEDLKEYSGIPKSCSNVRFSGPLPEDFRERGYPIKDEWVENLLKSMNKPKERKVIDAFSSKFYSDIKMSSVRTEYFNKGFKLVSSGKTDDAIGSYYLKMVKYEEADNES